MSFIGREAELKILEDAFNKKSSAFIPIYGRRRVGKSALIHKFMRHRPGLYFLGKTAPARLQLREFLEQAASLLDEPLIANMTQDDWKKALLEIVKRGVTRKQKLVLCLDEFQWLAAASPEISSILQECWDRHWKRSNQVMLILCGSFFGFMEREVLGRKSPLFGRRTAQILLKPFGYQDTAKFHPGWSSREQAKAYFLTGGVPLYLEALQSNHSIEQNIENAILTTHATLFKEPEFLLREELREVESYFAILVALASGATTPKHIANVTGLPERNLAYYLNQLREIGCVRKRYPLTGKRASARQVRYILHDAFLRFWFRFVFPHLSFLESQGAANALTQYLRPQLPTYFGHCFEELCREALVHIYQNEGLRVPFEIGEYWSKETQIDVVGYRQDDWTDLGECKWGSFGGQAAVREQLEMKIRMFPNQRKATIGRRFFIVRGARVTPLQNESWYSLDDLYQL